MNDAFLQRVLGAAASLGLLALAGCASLSADRGIDKVQTLAGERLGTAIVLPRKEADPVATIVATRQLLGHPLTRGDRGQIALLNNAGLQAQLADVGIAEADLAQAGMLRKPALRLHQQAQCRVHADRALGARQRASLLTMPLAQELAERGSPRRQAGRSHCEVVATRR